MKKTQKALAVGVAAVLACGTLAGCDALTTTDSVKDYAQIIATVDIRDSENFTTEFGADCKDFILPSEITKQEMAASFISNYSYLAQYGYDVSDIFDMIAESLAERQVRVQYAVAKLAHMYLTATEDKTSYADGDAAAYKAATQGKTGEEARVASLEFFLTDDEAAKAKYDVRVSVNSSLDSAEQSFINATDDDDSSSDSVRTLPTGADTENEDYFVGKPGEDGNEKGYAIYTGLPAQLTNNEYEPQDGSTLTTRKKAYNRFVASLRANSMLGASEETVDVETTSYFYLQLRSQYETAILNKVDDILTEEAEKGLSQTFAEKTFNETLAAQKEKFEDYSAFETDFNGISDSSLILATNDRNYGYVINILLPFSTAQSQQLTDATADKGGKGDKFATRQKLLEKIIATDQRGTWFTGSDDLSFVSTDAYTGDVATRDRLFFENSLTKSGEGEKYEAIKNYYGKYTYNGTATAKEEDGKTTYTLKPARIDIDGFLSEMQNYLGYAKDGSGNALQVSFDNGFTPAGDHSAYFAKDSFTFTDTADGHKKGDVDYSQFVYASGKVSGTTAFDANKMFVKGSWENTAFSVINELSFAYNTDTAGLNTYLGYMISPYKTSFMAEFEYAAQQVVAKGAGNFIVIPTDYGWHIIYCTFSFADMATDATTPYTFDYEARKGGSSEQENSFSYLYFEALKTQAVNSYLSESQSKVRNDYYADGTHLIEEAFADLKNLG